MPASTIGLTLKAGFPGTVSALPDDVVRTFQVNTGASIKIGQPVALVNVPGANPKIKPAGADGKTLGVALRGIRTPTGLNYTQLGAVVPEGEFVDVLLRGNCSVKLDSGTPVAEAAVNYDTATGNFTAAEVAGTVVASDNIVFATGMKDADGVTEITVKTRAI